MLFKVGARRRVAFEVREGTIATARDTVRASTSSTEAERVVQTHATTRRRRRQRVLVGALVPVGTRGVQEKLADRHRVRVVPVQVFARQVFLAQST